MTGFFEQAAGFEVLQERGDGLIVIGVRGMILEQSIVLIPGIDGLQVRFARWQAGQLDEAHATLDESSGD